MFADFVVHRKNWEKDLFLNVETNNIINAIYRSRIYSFDPAASAMAAELGSLSPDSAYQLMGLARLPYDHLWIELDRATYFGTMMSRGTMKSTPLDLNSKYVAFQYEQISETGWAVRVIDSMESSKSPDKMACASWPLVFLFDSNPVEDFGEAWAKKHGLEIYEANTLDFGWGYVNAQHYKSAGALARHVRFAANEAQFADSVTNNGSRSASDVMDIIMRELAGTVRRAMTCLLMLSIRPAQVSSVPRTGHQVVNAKVRPKLSYNELTLYVPGRRYQRISSKQVEKDLLREAKHLRRHTVRGHWRIRNGKTIWVKPHERGDVNLGYAPNRVNVKGRPITDS